MPQPQPSPNDRLGFHLSQTGKFILPPSRLGQHPNAHFHNWTLGSPALEQEGLGPAPTRDDCAAVAHSDDHQHLSTRNEATPSLPAGPA